jgi:hypothetical protein
MASYPNAIFTPVIATAQSLRTSPTGPAELYNAVAAEVVAIEQTFGTDPDFIPVDDAAVSGGPFGSSTQTHILTFDEFGVCIDDTLIDIASQPLVPIAITNANFTLDTFTFQRVDLSSGNVLGTLVAQPPDLTAVGFRVYKTGHTLTIAAGAGDTLFFSGYTGPLTYSSMLSGGVLQYNESAGIWDLMAS